MLNRSASLAMSTSIPKALPGKLDIKRYSPSILYLHVRGALLLLLWFRYLVEYCQYIGLSTPGQSQGFNNGIYTYSIHICTHTVCPFRNSRNTYVDPNSVCAIPK